MTKFNKQKSTSQKLMERPDFIKNHEGGMAFKATTEYELYLSCVSSFVEKIAYEKQSDYIFRVRNLCSKVSQKFILQLANYTRNKMNLRSISVLLFGEAVAKHMTGDGDSKDLINYSTKIIKRADEINEINEVMSYFINVVNNGKKNNMPNALKKAISLVMNNFNEYSYAKYNRKTDVKFKDVIKMVHPKPKNEVQSELFKKILNDNLETPNTWEVLISEKGASAEAWNEASKNMGFMALIRNIRNFETHNANQAIKKTMSVLKSKEDVLNSKQLPFRFYSAWKHSKDQKMKDALQKALVTSLDNIPKLNGNIAIFSDTSGSMDQPVSKKSDVTCMEIGCLMGAMALEMVDDDHDYISKSFATDIGHPETSIMDSPITNMVKIQNADTKGWGTNAYKCIDYLEQENFNADVIIIFSDMQCYGSWYDKQLAPKWTEYKRKNPNSILISVDLSSHGQLQFPEDSKDVVLMGGFSDHIFKMISMLKSKENPIQYIKNNY